MTLKEARIKRGLTQKELADYIGLSQETISQYESGNRTPSVIIAKKIANVLELSLDNIFFVPNISQ